MGAHRSPPDVSSPRPHASRWRSPWFRGAAVCRRPSVPDRAQLETLIASIGLLLVVFELIRRQKLTEEYSFLWILLGATLFVVSIRADMLAAAARLAGVADPAALPLVVAVAAMLIVCLCL